jgi:hypothetical protein
MLHRLVLFALFACSAGCSAVLGIDGDYEDLANSNGGNAGNDAGSAACAGVALSGVCWYLGAQGASCTTTCEPHGGDASAAASFVGVHSQGGALSECATLLTAVGYTATKPVVAVRLDEGVGCHVYGTQSYWLSAPAFSPDSQVPLAQVVCGCVE